MKMENSVIAKYEVIIGLEVHAQMLTRTKAFSSDRAVYGASPNSMISVTSLGHPGTLPVLNKRQVDYALMMGLATNCNINETNYFSRKNYFYADLPKGYQITQFETPICTGGFVNIKVNGAEKRIGITRIHIEEDAGKSIHDLDPYHTLIDLNRAGVPLIEIVSEPDLRSPDDAYQYLSEMRKLVRYLGICDGNMEEGSLRCDANVSVRIKGQQHFNDKVEVKNMNSIRNVKRALEHEILRQIQNMEDGVPVIHETRTFLAESGETLAMRTKEEAHDYRYFNEPDLPPLFVSREYCEEVKSKMPALPHELYEKFTREFSLSDYDAGVLTDEKGIALYFNEVAGKTESNAYKVVSNWVSGPVKSWLNEKSQDIDTFPLGPDKLAKLIDLVESGKINHHQASKVLFPAMLNNPKKEPESLMKELNLLSGVGGDEIEELISVVIAKYPDKVAAYKAGKKGLLGMFMGEVMKASKGKADPKKTNELIRHALDN